MNLYFFLVLIILIFVIYKEKCIKEHYGENEDDVFNKDTGVYTLINNNINFSLNDIFKKHIIDFFISNNIYIEDKLSIIGNIRDIYVKKENEDYYYIFNASLNNLTKFFVKDIKVKLKIENNNIHIIAIQIKELASSQNDKIVGIDKNTPIFYEIKNTLHLTDPFITSGKELVITDSMKINFNNILIKKSINSVNPVNTNKILN